MIWFNSNLKINNKIVFYPWSVDKGVLHVYIMNEINQFKIFT